MLFLAIYSQVQLSALINDWQGSFFNVLQQALSEPGSVSPEEYWPYVITLMAVLLPNIIFLVLLAFFTSHYVFRWRKAMTSYYMQLLAIAAHDRRRRAARAGRHACASPRSSRTWAPASSAR